MFLYEIYMNIENTAKSCNEKSCNYLLNLFNPTFFVFSTVKSFEILPKHNRQKFLANFVILRDYLASAVIVTSSNLPVRPLLKTKKFF